ncbi:MAG TPA: AbrB family transcriptional regulator [Candidatus Cybelea sp.]|nr:AbrB family transcriptional regulator [Candidatus Cybelea sp.]
MGDGSADGAGSGRRRVSVAFTLLALAIGAAGGVVFYYLRLPLPWMLGSMTATTAAALAGVHFTIDRRLRALFVTVLGVLLGSAFTPAVLAHAGDWTIGFGLLAVFLPASSAVLFVYFRRVAGMDATTAYFSSMPGGLNDMTIIGEAMGGDMVRIALVHATRVLIVVSVVPFYYRYMAGIFAGRAAATAAAAPLPLADIATLVACGAVGWFGARLAKLPAAQLVGPLVLSAAAHLLGATASRPPPELVAMSQIVIGAAVGSRFAGLTWRRISHTIALAVGSTVLLLLMAFAVSHAFEGRIPIQSSALMLALSPGGLTEMSLVALALGIDVAFVSSMHIARIAMVLLVAPLVFRLGRRDNGGATG